LVVIEICTHDGLVERIEENDLQFLRDSADELRTMVFDEDATTARQERERKRVKIVTEDEKDREQPAGLPTCYMCFDSEDEPDNPLIAPCDCRGDTRYVHLQCLQKWNGIGAEDGSSVICTTQGPAVCKVCKRRYKLRLKTAEGRTMPLLYKTLPAPYVCFLIVTKHENCPHLFGAQYQVCPAR
jgi:E3 ubiquitin-protein ligase DOA10